MNDLGGEAFSYLYKVNKRYTLLALELKSLRLIKVFVKSLHRLIFS